MTLLACMSGPSFLKGRKGGSMPLYPGIPGRYADGATDGVYAGAHGRTLSSGLWNGFFLRKKGEYALSLPESLAICIHGKPQATPGSLLPERKEGSLRTRTC
jgi:hypothetical protein